MAVVFVNGVEVEKGRLAEFSLLAFRVIDQKIKININCPENSRIRRITLSYLVFSPIYADFLAFGNMLSIPYF